MTTLTLSAQPTQTGAGYHLRGKRGEAIVKFDAWLMAVRAGEWPRIE